MILTLLRHGDVDRRYKNCYNGHNNITLSPEGRAQSQAIAKKLEGKNFDAIYSSDLPRAKETLSFFHTNTPIIYTKLLREKSWGRHEGMTFDAIIESEDFRYENFLQWITALDGENYANYIKRIELFFFSYLQLLPYSNILVVTHAGVIRVLMSIAKKLSLEEAFSINFGCACFVEFNLFTKKFKEIECV